MPTLRLFANLREEAGASRVQIEGETVGEVLDRAADQFGDVFEHGLESARVWKNGESAVRDDGVSESDELALIPPVSGGVDTVVRSSSELESLVILVVLATLVVTNVAGAAWWAAGLVGAAAVWVLDVTNVASWRGLDIESWPVFASIFVGAVGTHTLGASGFALAFAASFIFVLGWTLRPKKPRDLEAIATGLLLAIVSSAAVGSMILTRSAVNPGPQTVNVFLAMAGSGVLVTWLLGRVGRVPLIDPHSGGALAVVLVGVIAANQFGLEVLPFLLTSIGVALAMIAGRGFGSMVRTGAVSLTEQAPGALVGLDGAILAAALFFPLFRFVV